MRAASLKEEDVREDGLEDDADAHHVEEPRLFGGQLAVSNEEKLQPTDARHWRRKRESEIAIAHLLVHNEISPSPRHGQLVRMENLPIYQVFSVLLSFDIKQLEIVK